MRLETDDHLVVVGKIIDNNYGASSGEVRIPPMILFIKFPFFPGGETVVGSAMTTCVSWMTCVPAWIK